ncbi:MAG TPA: ABC transporter permease [Thermoanaerobaculia bacterium]|nr:ABC transporter permease [Thermoanaerobaculia bacterium]
MTTLFREVSLALRTLRKTPTFAIVALLTIAISVGATVSIFSVVHGILLDPLPYPSPERLVIVWQTDAHNDSWSEAASVPDYLDWKREATQFEALAANTSKQVNFLPAGGTPERLAASAITHDFFDVLGVQPLLGRSFTAEEDRIGAPPSVILTWSLWRERFGGNPGVLGQTINLDGREHTIVGVTSRTLWLGDEVAVLVPAMPAMGEFTEMRGVHNALVWGRLADGASMRDAQEEMSRISVALERLHPDDNTGRGARVEALHEAIVGDVRRPITILFGAALLVLLIGCANVAGLLIARGISRTPEMALRVSLGAGRGTLIRQLLIESITLSFLGGAFGVAISYWGVRLLTALAPESTPRIENVALNSAALTFALAASLICGLIFGLGPAIRISRQALARTMHTSARGSIGGGSAKSRQLLVVGEIALAVILTTGAGLMIQSFWNILRVDPGFQPQGLATFDVTLPEARYPSPTRAVYPEWPEVIRFYDSFLEELRATPGIESAAIAMNHPLRRGWTSTVTVDGREPVEGPRDEQRIRAVSPGYFATVRSPVLRGRDLNADDRSDSPFVVLVNQTYANRYFPNEDPIGRTISFWGKSRTIVGVAGDVRFMGLREDVDPAIYPPLTQVPQSQFAVVFRAGPDPMAHFGAVKAALARVEPTTAPANVRSLDQVASEAIGGERFQVVLLTLFGATALLLAAIGIFGLISYQVEQRRTEIGVRMALGADRTNVVRMIVSDGARLAAAGVLGGVAGALAVTRLLESLLFGVGARDAGVFSIVALTLATIALLASWIPARRAGSVEPASVLRSE